MSPRTAEQNHELREESRRKIMKHAMALFATHGYDQTSVRMITQSAGISQGLMYNYFESKEHLLLALFQRSVQDVNESFVRAEEADDPRELIAQLVRAAMAVVREHLDFWRAWYSVRMQPSVIAKLGADLPVWTDTTRQQLESYFRSAGVSQPAIEATVLFAVIDGVAQHYALEAEHYPLEEVVEAVIEKYQHFFATQ